MTDKPKAIDAERSLKIIAELTRTCKLLRNAYLEGRKEELTSIFNEYREKTDKVDRPHHDAITWGFKEAWREKDYAGIIKIGDLLADDYLNFNREAQALYLAAKKRVNEKKEDRSSMV